MTDNPEQLSFDFDCEGSDYIADFLEMRAEQLEEPIPDTSDSDDDLLEWYDNNLLGC